MMTSSNGNIFPVTGHLCGEFTGPGDFPAQRPVTQSFDVFFDLCLNKRMSKMVRLVIWDAVAPIMTSPQWWKPSFGVYNLRYKDKIAQKPSCFYNGNSYAGNDCFVLMLGLICFLLKRTKDVLIMESKLWVKTRRFGFGMYPDIENCISNCMK